ncbi:MAG TPA: SAM-dependent methyltransferase [Rickettsia endosymbiont of Columbicola hoogstraali]|nr:SAM-dependent methyltransferase [Rickettsia endosymbiont of Columbicola hoogstraali]
MKNYQYFDTLGQFYIEFLRYANNDKGLGIVLTPPHITELFSEIANITKDSIVLDTCTGTGGFLISAMKKMIIDAGEDNEKESNIKRQQIVGVELQHDLYSLLCSNMYIHGDGRSNLIKGNCFDNDIKNQISYFKPNIGLLNPPYKTNKNDIEELEFVLNALDLLEKGSLCIAIIPMSCMLAKKGTRLALKQRILNNHTLEVAFSMPDELFINSKVDVITSIIVLKAKEKHPSNYKTYFGYFKEDGFYKKKVGGRSDYDDKWSNIKNYWVENYKNKDEVEGHSVKASVSAYDEWCAESFMKTNYNNINKNIFEAEILRYSAYMFLISDVIMFQAIEF